MEFTIIPNEQTPKVGELDLQLTSEVDGYIKEHRAELEAFLEFAKTQTTAVGLAANQCSLNGERFMVRAFALRNILNHTWSLVIDPLIILHQGIKEIKAEGCLTWKGQKVLAERSRAVVVDYFDIDSNRHQGELHKGFEGQIWQHEVNHLNGVPEQIVSQSTPDPPPIKVGRNEKCPCGSNLKYKHCCLLLI